MFEVKYAHLEKLSEEINHQFSSLDKKQNDAREMLLSYLKERAQKHDDKEALRKNREVFMDVILKFNPELEKGIKGDSKQVYDYILHELNSGFDATTTKMLYADAPKFRAGKSEHKPNPGEDKRFKP